MKKALILLSILVLTLTLVLLAGCSGEAKEPAPAWPERLTGEYDANLTFTLKGTAPEAAGVDSLTGRMTALFPTDSGTLALGWRRVAGAEAELLEDYLSGTGSEVGVWERDTAAPNALESYVRLGLAQRMGDRWRFTPRGFLLSNRLIGELLDAQAEQKYHMGIPWRKEDYYDTLF